tara:strand:+ start:471 stop:653 length:183 start_codon:yes stop_codon:yes gene_type:complete
MSKTILKIFAKADAKRENDIEVDVNIPTVRWKSMSKRQQDKVIQTRMASMFRYEVSHSDK